MDGLGRTVQLDASAKSIVSLAPSLTEIVFAVGAETSLSAVTDYCDYPVAAKTLPSIGKGANPDIEKIISFMPDLVLMTTEGNQKNAGLKIMELGLGVYVSNPLTLKDIASDIRNIGMLAGCSGQAEAVAMKFDVELERIENIKGIKPRLIYLVWSDPIIPAGSGTYIDDLITAAGAFNVASEAGTRWPRISMETILAWEPEIILLSRDEKWSGGIADSFSGEGWERILAVRNERVYFIDENTINRPSPRILEAVRFVHEKVMEYRAEQEEASLE